MYKQYNTDQLSLPMDIQVLIPQNHLARLIDLAVDKMDSTVFFSLHPGGCRPQYHPKMMLKVILYAYSNRIYSSRQIAKQPTENIVFMWLSGEQHPDFHTINRFRSDRMKEVIYETFFSVADLLRGEGLVKLEDYFLDGTKIEANANKYSFVWRKSTEKYIRSSMKNINRLFWALNKS
jgi:transposase